MLNQVFIDCMPGPTSHFGGHSIGNIASMTSKNMPSNPKKAAIEWLDKVSLVQSLGAKQIVLPPHRRPLIHHANHPRLENLSSGFIWMANAGHFIPATDTTLHAHQFIPANMKSGHHRKNEHRFHAYWIKQILKNINHHIHSPLRACDEGAANAIRLWKNNQSIFILVHGHPKTAFPSRQSKDSFNELQSLVKLKNLIILQQKSKAIDHGVFHNDVISFGFKNVLFCHEHSFEDQKNQLYQLNQLFLNTTKSKLHIIQINEQDLPLTECIDTYLFNSQVILINNKITLLSPKAAKRNEKSFKIIQEWIANDYIHDVKFIDINSSLMNGGGPACLRLCIYLLDSEIHAIPRQFWLTSKKINELKQIIETKYPSSLDLSDIQKKTNHYRSISKEIEGLFINNFQG